MTPIQPHSRRTDDTHDVLLPEMTDDRELLPEGTQNEENVKCPDRHQPLIGIPIPVQQGEHGPLFQADAVGAWAVERMGARIFFIPLWPFPTHKHVYQSLWPLMQSMDGLFLPASTQGADWYLHWKESEHQPGPQNWSISWEIALVQLATSVGMPLLAVADGDEKWNSALGGKKREAQNPSVQIATISPDMWERKAIRVRAQSTLASYLQPAMSVQDSDQARWELAFLPNQGVENVASGLRSCAHSKNGDVIVFERRDRAFGLGILGRLDWGLDQIYSTALFDAFLHACRSFATTRRQHRTTWEASRDRMCATISERVIHHQPLIPIPFYEDREHHS